MDDYPAYWHSLPPLCQWVPEVGGRCPLKCQAGQVDGGVNQEEEGGHDPRDGVEFPREEHQLQRAQEVAQGECIPQDGMCQAPQCAKPSSPSKAGKGASLANSPAPPARRGSRPSLGSHWQRSSWPVLAPGLQAEEGGWAGAPQWAPTGSATSQESCPPRVLRKWQTPGHKGDPTGHMSIPKVSPPHQEGDTLVPGLVPSKDNLPGVLWQMPAHSRHSPKRSSRARA